MLFFYSAWQLGLDNGNIDKKLLISCQKLKMLTDLLGKKIDLNIHESYNYFVWNKQPPFCVY